MVIDSSITLVFISPNMRETWNNDVDQWIPWEVAYSLREDTRAGRQSKTNAVLAVVLPDSSNSYRYFIEEGTCAYCNCRTLKTNTLFNILRKNMFNIKDPTYSSCTNHNPQSIYTGDYSYIESIKWSDFINNIDYYLDKAVEINDKIKEYNITKTV